MESTSKCVSKSRENVSIDVCNRYLLKCVNTLKLKKKEMTNSLNLHQKEKRNLEAMIKILTDKLQKINELIDQEQAIIDDYNDTISQTETAYLKITSNSNALKL